MHGEADVDDMSAGYINSHSILKPFYKVSMVYYV